MGYNAKQYDAAADFLPAADANIIDPMDSLRVRAYDLYENIYKNATKTLKLVMRGDDQAPILIPNGRKIIETTHRFLGKNLGYYVEVTENGDVQTRELVEKWWENFWKRETFPAKFSSNKRWGLVRGDACFYISANPAKEAGTRIIVTELDPRQVFEIEDPNDSNRILGYHVVDLIQDLREPDKPDKKVARRRTFKRLFDETTGQATGVSSALGFFEVGKWDDRTVKAQEKLEPINDAAFAALVEEEFVLPRSITQLPIYKWTTRAPQNSTWGESLLSGMETLLYAINQSISDEDATLVFQGLGMYVTTAAPPLDDNNQISDWNIGPKQIIEISGDQRFERVSGVSDVSPFITHLDWLDDHGISEAAGVPQIAVGRVDVSVAESGISLQLQMGPLIASNEELELEIINVLDQMFYDITTMWLPAYETDTFGGSSIIGEPTDNAIELMKEMSVVCLFDNPMPKNRDAEVQEVVLLDSANLILKSMAVAKLRELGWKFPSVDPYTQEPLDDEDIAEMLLEQAREAAAAMDPFAASGGLGGEDLGGEEQPQPDERVINLGSS